MYIRGHRHSDNVSRYVNLKNYLKTGSGKRLAQSWSRNEVHSFYDKCRVRSEFICPNRSACIFYAEVICMLDFILCFDSATWFLDGVDLDVSDG